VEDHRVDADQQDQEGEILQQRARVAAQLTVAHERGELAGEELHVRTAMIAYAPSRERDDAPPADALSMPSRVPSAQDRAASVRVGISNLG
jgi:hypothetical protein